MESASSEDGSGFPGGPTDTDEIGIHRTIKEALRELEGVKPFPTPRMDARVDRRQRGPLRWRFLSLLSTEEKNLLAQLGGPKCEPFKPAYSVIAEEKPTKDKRKRGPHR